MNRESKQTFVGRGSSFTPNSRFEKLRYHEDFEHLDSIDQEALLSQKIATEYFFDQSETIVSENNSPDVDFRYSLNPYRGCSHGCSYCYARPTHEYLGFNPGIDFESKIMVKLLAAELFTKWLARPQWKEAVEPIMMSGVTDCYQSCEKQFELTRQCLQVADEYCQPIRIITKNALIQRDIDLLSKLAQRNLVSVAISLPTLDQSLTRVMEPRCSSPEARLTTITKLASAGVPVRVLIAPIVPGITDHELADILQAVSTAGASYASYTVLRLPSTVEPVFFDWLDRHFPDRKSKVIQRLKNLRGGRHNDSRFFARMQGTGIHADQIAQLFTAISAKVGLQTGHAQLRNDLFQSPSKSAGQQLELF